MNIFYTFVFLILFTFHEGSPVEKMDTDGADETGFEINTALVDNDISENRHDLHSFVGTNLFAGDGCRQKCFSSEDIAVLAARRDFESLIPKYLPKCLLDDKMVMILIQYFYGANQVIQRVCSGELERVSERAFYDALGGYLKHYMIPITKYSFYGGLVCLRTVENVLRLYKQCNIFLNTNGNGWINPIENVLNDFNVHVEPLRIFVSGQEMDETPACINLEMSSGDADDEHIIVSLPKLDPEENDGYLGNVWLPFRRKRTFNLRSAQSAFIILKYFDSVSRCYHFQSICQDTFNRKFKEWILENVEIHLADDILYPGLGAVLRIYETLRRGNSPVVSIMPRSSENANKLVSKASAKKRQKSHEYRLLEHKAKELDSSGWFSKMFSGSKRQRQDDSEEEENTNPGFESEQKLQANDFEDRQKRMKYIYVTVIISVILLIIVVIGAVLTEHRNRQNKSMSSNKPPPRNSRRCRFCKFGKCSKHNHDVEDEITVKPESSSVISSSKRSSVSKTKSEGQPRSSASSCGRCLPMCVRANNTEKSVRAETTSIESTSEMENKNIKEKRNSQKLSPQTRAVTIDEKSKKTSRKPSPTKLPVKIPNQRKTNDNSGRKVNQNVEEPNKLNGLDSLDRSSWETLYDSK